MNTWTMTDLSPITEQELDLFVERCVAAGITVAGRGKIEYDGDEICFLGWTFVKNDLPAGIGVMDVVQEVGNKWIASLESA
jgi:hypothetical protein